MCPTVANPDLVLQESRDSQSPTHSGLAECGSRQAIQTRPDYSDRLVSPSNLPIDMHPVASTSRRPFCNEVQQQAASPVPDSLALAVDAYSLPWEDLDPYAFPPVAILGRVVAKLRNYTCRRIILIAPGWPNMPWFWNLVALLSQIP